MKYGYIRVSTKEQNTGRQITALTKAEVDEKNIFIDRLSGNGADSLTIGKRGLQPGMGWPK